MLPDFIIVGASRSGTTTLWHYLKNHPQVFMPEKKELRFFEQDDYFLQGQTFYESYFKNSEMHKVRGEASPPYFEAGITKRKNNVYRFDSSNDVPFRIQKMLPDVKIIITLRSPITRTFSQFVKNLRQGKEKYYSLKKAIKAELNGERSYLNDHTSWIYKNTYSIHLKRWFDLFPKENILVLIFENWKKNPETALQKISDFLEVDKTRFSAPELDVVKNKNREPKLLWLHRLQTKYFGKSLLGKLIYRINQKDSNTSLSQDEFTMLRDIFTEDIEKVAQMLGEDLSI